MERQVPASLYLRLTRSTFSNTFQVYSDTASTWQSLILRKKMELCVIQGQEKQKKKRPNEAKEPVAVKHPLHCDGYLLYK